MKSQFVANKWLAVEKSDGQIDRILSVSGPNVPIKRRFHQSKENHMRQSHLWLSAFMRPPKSRFTRCQRVACVFSLIFLTMLTNIMWYGAHNPKESIGFFSGFISLSPEEIVIGILSNFIALPFVLFIVFLFKYSRPRELRENRMVQALFSDETEDDLENVSRPQSAISNMSRSSTSTSATQRTRPVSAISAVSVASTISTTSTSSNISQYEATGNTKFSLHWLCTYLAWVLCILSILASSSFIVIYGIALGNDKTYRWLTAILVTIGSSFFALEPLKIILMAVFYHIFCGTSMDSDIDNSDEDEEAFILDDSDDWYADTKTRRTRVYQPYSKTYLEALKAARIKDIKNQAVAFELFSYSLFLVILFLISYANRDPDSYRLKNHMERNLIIKNRFDKLNTTDDWWRWAHKTLVSEIKAGPLYNGRPAYGLRGYIGDHTQRMMGFANLRQIRVRRNTCRVAMQVQNITKECAKNSELVNEDIRDYCNAWEEMTDLTRELPSCIMPEFKYKTAEELDGFLVSADLDMYSGGGYIANIKGPNKDIKKNLLKLQQQRWINNQTRAVMMEFATYNPNINLFIVVTVTAEFIPGGGIRPHWRMDPIRLITPLTGHGVFIYACMLLFLIFLVYFFTREIGEIAQRRLSYWTSYWSWVEWFIILTSISAVGFWTWRHLITDELLVTFSRTFGNGYMKLQKVALIDEFYGYHLAFLIFFANIKLLKILEFNHKMSLLIYTLAGCWSDLSGFLGIFFMAFGAFVQMFYFILYTELADFKTLTRTFQTCFTMMLNKFKFGTLKETSTVAAVMFFFFAVSVNWILVNVLLTIIIEGYEQVKKKLAGQGNELEVIQYIKDAARSLAGKGPRPGFLEEFAPEGNGTGEVVVEREGEEGEADGEDEGSSVVNELPVKIDEFLEYINRLYFDGGLDLGTKKVLKDNMRNDEEETVENNQEEEDLEAQLEEAERLEGDEEDGNKEVDSMDEEEEENKEIDSMDEEEENNKEVDSMDDEEEDNNEVDSMDEEEEEEEETREVDSMDDEEDLEAQLEEAERIGDAYFGM